MKLIIGLGNPGFAYRGTRHNIGFTAVKALAKSAKIALKKENRIAATSGKGIIAGSEVLISMPLTYMNLSGTAITPLLKKYAISPADILVVYDDLDIEFGRLKVKQGGSAGGHRGLESVIQALGSTAVNRLRIGIGRPQEASDAAEYVLSGFNRRERPLLPEIIDRASACCRSWITHGIDETMNLFNAKETA
jgi:peptidyl-tRNA hydrolase, PTH1 family